MLTAMIEPIIGVTVPLLVTRADIHRIVIIQTPTGCGRRGLEKSTSQLDSDPPNTKTSLPR